SDPGRDPRAPLALLTLSDVRSRVLRGERAPGSGVLYAVRSAARTHPGPPARVRAGAAAARAAVRPGPAGEQADPAMARALARARQHPRREASRAARGSAGPGVRDQRVQGRGRRASLPEADPATSPDVDADRRVPERELSGSGAGARSRDAAVGPGARLLLADRGRGARDHPRGSE